MKVKIGQLKTHLSRYLRELQREGGSIEVCVREQPVAYLTLAHPADATDPDGAGVRKLQQELQAVGLRWSPARAAAEPFKPSPVPAGDGRKDVVSMDEMRSGRNW